MQTSIVKTFRFHAAHELPHHDGKCARLHGHEYVLEVEIGGSPRDADGSSGEGMVLDFSIVSILWRTIEDAMFDHRNLNETIGPQIGPTTAENIAGWLFDYFAGAIANLDRAATVVSVTLWETSTSRAIVRNPGLGMS